MAGSKYQEILYDLALEHDGYFTIVEAKQASVPSHRVSQLARRGSIERVGRGVYRLRHYPVPPDRAQFWEAVLWPQLQDDDPQAVLSHQTALALWGLSDVNPAKIHISLPKAKRMRRRPPSVLKLHRINLSGNDVTSYNGLPITTVERTLRDCIGDGEVRFAVEGIRDAWNKKLITQSQRRALEQLVEHA